MPHYCTLLFSETYSFCNSVLCVQFLWPLLAIIEILTKDLHLFSLHDMFRRLAPCSRGGFYKNDKLSNKQQTRYLGPQEKWEWGQRFTIKSQCLKNLDPSGVFPPWGSPAVSLPLFSCWLEVRTAGSASVAPVTRLQWWCRPPPACWCAAGWWLAHSPPRSSFVPSPSVLRIDTLPLVLQPSFCRWTIGTGHLHPSDL